MKSDYNICSVVEKIAKQVSDKSTLERSQNIESFESKSKPQCDEEWAA